MPRDSFIPLRDSIALAAVLALSSSLAAKYCSGAPEELSKTPTPAVEQQVDFLRDVRPILSDACFACHGPDESSRAAELRLDERESAFRIAANGHGVIQTDDPDASELVRRITSGDEDEIMPPVDSGKKLTAAQIDVLRRWIAQGASWKEHWAFSAPVRPKIPQTNDSVPSRNPIDAFVRQALDQKGWSPAPEADRETLIRRVTFDLTGLPPTLAEVDAFLKDESPDAYERAVDRLLASPNYGEHMARFWLDAARYGDTHGLHLDNYREMWLYRDWVIDAFNSNMPFDQFTIQQLAGDLLPQPTPNQLVATGFCRANVTTNEGGSIEEEVYVRNVVDRVSTVGTVFMGLTLGCAVCHDHKYDPLTQKDFYQLFAYFNSLDGPVLDGNVQDPSPAMRVPGKELSAWLAALQDRLDDASASCDALEGLDEARFEEWVDKWLAGEFDGAEIDSDVDVSDGMVAHCTFEEGGKVNVALAEDGGTIHGSPIIAPGPMGNAIALDAEDYIEVGPVGDFQDDEPFSYGAWINPKSSSGGVIIAKTDSENLYRGYELSVRDDRLVMQFGRRDPGYLITIASEAPVASPGQWTHVFVTYDGSKEASGVAMFVNGVRQPTVVLSDSLRFKSGIRNKKPLLIGRKDASSVFTGLLDDARVYKRRLTDTEVLILYLTGRVDSLRHGSPDAWTEQDLRDVRRYFLIAYDPNYRGFRYEIDRLRNQMSRDLALAPTTLIWREQQTPREAYILLRGQYDQRGEQVGRHAPAALPPMASNLPANRLGLAQWLVSPGHPLTSRVTVNRLWQQFFGMGLVRTSEDFGNQGTPPTHPELLDWLAVEFRESGWDVKSLVRLMVTSATYRQSSKASADSVLRDPDNASLARGPRRRLDAETLRDQALAVSGLLVNKVGGPSVKPPQPEGLWEAVGFVGSNTAIFFPDVGDEKLHRRSIYTFLKRTAPAPEMSTFDAPSRESPCVRRERTNTPMQALLLMNDPQYVEAAKALANRVMSEKTTTRDRAAHMYRLCTAKTPSDEVVSELVELYEDQRALYQQEADEARSLISQWGKPKGEDQDLASCAAWTLVGNLALNLDEVINSN